MKSIIPFLIFVLLGCFAYPSETPKGKILGEVIDRDTKQIVIGAVIEVMNTKIFTATDVNGKFIIENLDPKTYHLKISAPYYVTTFKTDISVSGTNNVSVVIELKLASYETEDVVVTSEKYFDKPADFFTSTNALSAEEIRRAPGAAEDVSRMVQSLPGVSTATDSRNDLIVRGGSPIENFIMVDGIEVPNINHFSTQGASGGPIGMINGDFLSDVTFSAGGFPARYGDRLSSIMDITYRSGNRDNFSGKFDLGVAGAGFIIEGPVQKEKSSFIISARKSYLDLIASSTGLTAVPNYTNFNLKVTYDISETHKLAFVGMGGIDEIYFGGRNDEDDPNIQTTDYDGWQAIGGISHKWLIGASTYLQTSFSATYFDKTIKLDSTDENNNPIKLLFSNNSRDAEYVFRSDLSQRFSPTDLLEVGIVGRYLNNDNKFYKSPFRDNDTTWNDGIDYSGVGKAYKFGSYIQYSKNLFQRLDLTAGIRQDYFDYLNQKNKFSPRVSAGYRLLDNLKLNAAYGTYFQAPPLLWLVSYEENKDLKQIQANQIVGGIEYYPFYDLKISLEYFDKKYYDYPNSISTPQYTYANAGAEYGPTGLEKLLPASNGYARGLEFFVQKKLSDNIYGTLNYSYSKIRFTSLDGIERSSSYDYQNILTVIVGYKIFDFLEFSAKYRYMGGKPYTPIDEFLSNKYNQTIYDYSRYNAERFEAYQRLDIRIDYRQDYDGWSLVSYLDFENVFNTKNIDQLFWDQKNKEIYTVYQWAFLPAGGIKVEF